jgi:hypothetical protein
MIILSFNFNVEFVLNGQFNSALWHRTGNINIIEMSGLKAQLKLPFQGDSNNPGLNPWCCFALPMG